MKILPWVKHLIFGHSVEFNLGGERYQDVKCLTCDELVTFDADECKVLKKEVEDMLSGRIANLCEAPKVDDRYARDFKEDMKTAMDYLFAFREGLEKLHPDCTRIMEKLLHNPQVMNY